jgi:hypothetical protein
MLLGAQEEWDSFEAEKPDRIQFDDFSSHCPKNRKVQKIFISLHESNKICHFTV